MNILFNGNPIKEPTEMTTRWTLVQGRLLRQVRLAYTALTEGEAAALLGPGLQPTVALSCRNPATGNNLSLTASCVEASAPVIREEEGALHYGPVALTLQEVPAP